MRKKCVCCLILICLIFTSPLFSQEKIGIVEFDERSPIELANASQIIPEILAEVIVNAGVYDVTERLLLDKVLEEQKLALSGVVDERSLPEIGNIYGLDGIVTGTYMQVGKEITISARLIDTTTAEVVSASTVNFTDIDDIKSEIEILGYELSGISRNELAVMKEDKLRDQFRGGVFAGIGIGDNDHGDGPFISIPFGCFVTGKSFFGRYECSGRFLYPHR